MYRKFSISHKYFSFLILSRIIRRRYDNKHKRNIFDCHAIFHLLFFTFLFVHFSLFHRTHTHSLLLLFFHFIIIVVVGVAVVAVTCNGFNKNNINLSDFLL